MVKRRKPETRRKIPNYFPGREDLRLTRRLESWEVSHFCGLEGRWHYETLEAGRIGPKLKAEAIAAAAKLLRVSALRWNKASAEAADKWHALLADAEALQGATELAPTYGCNFEGPG
jgi:hypothetical protein